MELDGHFPFLSFKEGAADLPLNLRSKYLAQQYQAEFSMSAVTSALRKNFGSYGS
jgi:hypothetical protein